MPKVSLCDRAEAGSMKSAKIARAECRYAFYSLERARFVFEAAAFETASPSLRNARTTRFPDLRRDFSRVPEEFFPAPSQSGPGKPGERVNRRRLPDISADKCRREVLEFPRTAYPARGPVGLKDAYPHGCRRGFCPTRRRQWD